MDDHLLRYKLNQKYVLVDTETTGLSLWATIPWELAVLHATGKKVENVEDHWIKWPDLKVSPDAARVTGFTYEEYNRRALENEAIYDKLWAILNDPSLIIIGQNYLAYDLYIIKTWARLLNKPFNYDHLNRVLDTKALSMAYRLNIKEIPIENRLAFQYKCLHYIKKGLKTSLGTMGKEFGIKFSEEELHSADYDSRLNFAVFWQLLHKLDI